MSGVHLQFVTYRQLLKDVANLAGQVPSDVTAVAGIPRSGILPATILSQMLHLPLLSICPTGLHALGHGRRLKAPTQRIERLLVVDDSARRGNSLEKALKTIEIPRHQVVTAVVYAHDFHLKKYPRLVDMFVRKIPSPRLFEWNLFNHVSSQLMMADIDGVICRDPATPDNDGKKYAASLVDAIPLNLPRRTAVHALITHRLERWRSITANWLAKYNICYEQLIMAPQKTAAERRTELSPYGVWKGEYYRDSPCTVFVESDELQAQRIRCTSSKPVICLTTGKVFS